MDVDLETRVAILEQLARRSEKHSDVNSDRIERLESRIKELEERQGPAWM